MSETKNKYQTEYENSQSCFWDTKPAKFVIQLANIEDNFSNLSVLDLGAGEGKNAVFLANLGACVLAVDISSIALSRFKFQPNYKKCKNKITLINSDIKDVSFNESSFEVILAYGLLHCLDSRREILETLAKIKMWLKPYGYFVCATFTDNLPIPEVQSYLNKAAFLSMGELEKNLDGFTIIKCENSTITESHPTTKIEHSHSIVRLIAKKNG